MNDHHGSERGDLDVPAQTLEDLEAAKSGIQAQIGAQRWNFRRRNALQAPLRQIEVDIKVFKGRSCRLPQERQRPLTETTRSLLAWDAVARPCAVPGLAFCRRKRVACRLRVPMQRLAWSRVRDCRHVSARNEASSCHVASRF